ncbi:hypothetical protein G9A89_020444 [Geosiphon pyriformis]|nr:hypothetical protein G9A89_020444 [Geosiphon pyriformis]
MKKFYSNLSKKFFLKEVFTIQYDISKLFLFDYKTTIGPNTAIIKKAAKSSGSGNGFETVLSKKKRREGVLKDSSSDKKVASKVQESYSWGSETGNTTESESIDIEEECLMEETSFDFGEGGALAGGNHDQTLTSLKVKTKKALGKPLGKIDFSKDSDGDSILSDTPLELPPPLKNLINVSVRKSFTLDIGLDKVAGNSSQEKLVVIIRATFTSESSLMKATDKAASAKILVNTNLKKSSGRSDRAVVIKEIPIGTLAEAVCTALSKFGVIKAIKMQLIELADLDKEAWDAWDQHRALLYTLPMGTNTHDIWGFVRSVDGKTCIIDHHSVIYNWARCAVVCFDSAESLDTAVGTTPVLKNTNLCWSRLISAKCAKCGKLGHMSLGCVVGKKFFFGSSLCRVFSDADKSRLTIIYAKRSAPVVRPVFFGGLSWAKVARGSSLLSLSSQNVLVDNGSSSEMKPSLLVTIEVNNRFATLEHSLVSLMEQVGKLAKRLDALRPMVSQPSPGCQPLVTPLSQDQRADVVMSESSGASISSGNVAGVVSFDMSSVSKLENSMKCLMEMVLGLLAKVDSISVCSGMNNPAKQKDIIRWHKEINNMVSIITETKLRSKVHSWIADKFDDVRVFTSGLNSGHLGMGVAVVLDISLARHVYKVSEVPGWLLSIKLLFKDKLSVLILGLYAGASSAAVNESSFTVLGGNFNEDDSCKYASFRKCLDLGLANSLVGSLAVKMPTWANSKGVKKTIDYVLVSSNLVNAIVHRGVSNAGEYFEMDYQAVSVSLGGLLDMQLNSFRKQNKFKSATAANAIIFSDDFIASQWFSDLDAITFDIEAGSLDDDNASVVRSLFLSGSPLDTVRSALSKTKKRRVVPNVPDIWHRQYQPLDYIFDEAFSGVIQPIEFLNLLGMVSDLPIGKAAGLSGISNKLWMHSDRSVLNMLLVLLNSSLIETAHKIFSKILSDRILLACSAHDIFHGDNFSVLKGTTIQTPIFAIGSVVEDALEKNRELWLVYDSVGWKHLKRCLVKIKICGKFIHFFGNIHRNWTNQVMTDFSLTDDYRVHDGLDQGEESVCEYRLNSHFVSRSGRAESQAGFSTFFAVGAYVDDTIWIDSSQAAIQHILNVVSEFFRINDISINNDKTVAIPINARISNPSLFISGSPIFITKKGESYRYLGIFLSTDGFSKPSLAKVHSDVCFFSNLVLKKAVSDKQFLYLVLAVLHPIVSYRTQFSFVPVSVCDKWDALIHKSLKLKAGLPLDFSSNTIHHPSFYGLKSFSQCQSENKVVLLISFANFCGVLGQLFSHRSYDLQVLCWCPIHLLSSLACIHVSVFNNFLSGMVCILLECNLSLGGSLAGSFQFRNGVPMSTVLGEFLFFKYLPSLQRYGIAFKLDFCGPVLEWFGRSVAFLSDVSPFPLALSGVGPTDICSSNVGTDSLAVYTDGSVKNLGTTGCRTGTAAFFEDIDLDLGVYVQGLMSSTLAELQIIALALECIPVDCFVRLFLDSQAALDAYKSEVDLVCPDFCNQCWVECRHIRNIIHGKNLKVSWHKVKGHSGVLGNDCADSIIDTAAFSDWFLSSRKVSSGSGFLAGNLHSDVNWLASFRVWHPDLHMATGFTSRCTANIRTYFMKALYHRLPMAVRKHIYDKCYSSVLCLYCGEVEVSDYVFSCIIDDAAHHQVLESYMFSWKVLFGLFLPALCVLQLLLTCATDLLVFSTLCKGFVFKGWLQEAVSVFHVPKVAGVKIADFVCSVCVVFRNNIWLVCAKYRAYMERNGLIPVNGLVPVSISGLTSRFSDGVVKLLGVVEVFGVCFGFRKSYSFFSGIGDSVSINIIV